MASVATLLLAGCAQEKTTNPFFAEQYGTEYEIPPFSEITTAHIREALLKGYEEQKQEIQARMYLVRCQAATPLRSIVTWKKRLLLSVLR